MSQNNKDGVSLHRLFVGGLFTGIKEDDLTSRLNKFGTVKNVYIHERQNDNGDITKTFAELEMETSERNLSRCFSAYSNTIWKGNTMRLQKYKEDPFERTRKRRENMRTAQTKQFSHDQNPEQFPRDNRNSQQFSHDNRNSQQFSHDDQNSQQFSHDNRNSQQFSHDDQNSQQFAHDNQNSRRQFSYNNRNSQEFSNQNPGESSDYGQNSLRFKQEQADGHSHRSPQKRDSVNKYHNNVTDKNVVYKATNRISHDKPFGNSASWDTAVIPAGPKRRMDNQSSPAQKHKSAIKLEHADDTESSSESEDEGARQGVPKFGGIALRSNAKTAKRKGKQEMESNTASHQFKKAKAIRADSDNDSVATDEIIAVSKLRQKDICTNDSHETLNVNHKADRKHKKSLNVKSSNEDGSHASLQMKETKSVPAATHKPRETSKGVLGRLEGFSAVWQDGSDVENESAWKSKLDNGRPSDLKFAEENSKRHQSQKIKRVKNEAEDCKVNSKIKIEYPMPKFSPTNNGNLPVQREPKRELGNYSQHSANENKEKHVQDNYKRLESMKKLQSTLADKKKTIGMALSFKGETQPMPNKKIKFDSDGEEEFGNELQGDSEWNLEDSTTKARKSQEHGKKGKKEKQLRLFDDDDDGENDAMEDTTFDVRPQFEGAAGERLFKLQSRFGDDKRFVVDQRFLEDSSGSESDTNRKTTKEIGVEELEDEKLRHLQILQTVIGNDVAVKRKDKAPVTGNAAGMLRYDPTKDDHGQFEIKVAERDKTTAKPKKLKKAEPEPLPEVSKETFFKVSGNLKNIFEKTTAESQSFSLLKALGRDNNETVEDKIEQTEGYNGTISIHERKTKLLGENVFKYDSSDDDEDLTKEIFTNSPSGTKDDPAPMQPVGKQCNTFFFQSNDPRLSNSVSFFCRTEPLDVLQKKWKEVWHTLHEDLLTKSKRSVRRKAPRKEKKGSMPKRRFKPPTRKQYK